MITESAKTLTVLSMHLEVLSETGGTIQVRCRGDVVIPDYGPDGDPLARLLGPQVYESTVLLDMEKATFLDTTGVTWLVSCHRNFENAGGRLILHSLPLRVRNILRLLNLEGVLHIVADADAARFLCAKEKS